MQRKYKCLDFRYKASSDFETSFLMSLIAGGGEPPSGLSAFKTVGSQLAVTAGTLLCNNLLE